MSKALCDWKTAFQRDDRDISVSSLEREGSITSKADDLSKIYIHSQHELEQQWNSYVINYRDQGSLICSM